MEWEHQDTCGTGEQIGRPLPPDVGDFAFTRRERHNGGVGVPGSARY